jgi:hypothetical protein
MFRNNLNAVSLRAVERLGEQHFVIPKRTEN